MADLEKVAIQSTTIPTDPDATPKVAAATTKERKEPQVPPSYKIIKVRKPDGTIVKVKRLIDPAQSTAEKKPTDTIAAAAANGIVATAPTATENETQKLLAEKQSTLNSTAVPKTASPSTSSQPKSTSSKSDTTPQKPPAAAATTQPKQRSTRPFFSAFAVRAVAALIPSIGDIGDLHDGDEIVDDGDNDSDGFDDDDDNGGHDDMQHGDSTPEHHRLEHNAAMAGATGLAAGLAAPPAYASNHNNAGNGEKAKPQINEKEVGDISKPGEPEARSLHKAYSEWTRYIIWFVMIIFPVLFIVLGVLTAILPKRDYGGTYEAGLSQAIKVAVSAWPIIFAAIAAQTLRTIASYKVERGIRLMTLEQLMGSNSVASSIKQPFLLRKFDLVTIALLALWGLSPLATQAMQRMYTTIQVPSNITTTVWYLNTWQSNLAFGDAVIATGEDVAYGNIITNFFDASILPPGPDQVDYQDVYLRPKVPIIEHLDSSDADEDGWIFNSASDYSSNYGIPLESMNLDGDYEFIFTSSYLHFECLFLNKTYMAEINKTWPSLQGHQLHDNLNNTSPDIFMDIVPQNQARQTGSVIYASLVGNSWNADGTDQLYAYSVCQFNQSFVDSLVDCSNTLPNNLNANATGYVPPTSDCYVDSVRKTLNPLPMSNMSDFIIGFLSTAGELVDNYLWDPTNLTDLYGQVLRDITKVGLQDFETRLALLINTYWQLGFGPTVQDAGLDHTIDGRFGINTNSSQASVIITQPAYTINVGWLVALFLCSVILLLAGLTSMIVDARTIVPDMLGFASTLARKSKYVDLPKVNSSMSGAERARLLGKHRVMMQDVKPNAAVGRVALGSASGGAKRLERGRPYR